MKIVGVLLLVLALAAPAAKADVYIVTNGSEVWQTHSLDPCQNQRYEIDQEYQHRLYEAESRYQQGLAIGDPYALDSYNEDVQIADQWQVDQLMAIYGQPCQGYSFFLPTFRQRCNHRQTWLFRVNLGSRGCYSLDYSRVYYHINIPGYQPYDRANRPHREEDRYHETPRSDPYRFHSPVITRRDSHSWERPPVVTTEPRRGLEFDRWENHPQFHRDDRDRRFESDRRSRSGHRH